MKKAQEKACLGSEASTKSRNPSSIADSLGIIQNIMASYSIPSTSQRILYAPISNTSSQGKRGDTREIDNRSDTPKKKNRRRERKHKTKATEQKLDTASSGSTPHSSPSVSKPKLKTPVSISDSIHRFAGINHLDISPQRELKCDGAVKKRKSREELHLIEPRFSYEIHPVESPKSGKAFRKRSKKHKYINLKTFLGLSKTCIFKTEFGKLQEEIGQLSAALKNLSLGPKSKKMNRKYFDNVDKNVKSHREQVSMQSTVSKTKRHSELLISKTGRDEAGHEVVQSVLVLEDTSIQVRQDNDQGSQTSTPKRLRRPKKEKHRKHKLEKKQAKEAQEVFPAYVSDEDAKIGEKSGEFIRGFVRVNPKNSRDSYVNNENSALPDYHVTSIADRNRALDGDEVLLKLKPEAEWQEGRKTAVVVCLLNRIHPRTTVGNLKPAPSEPGYAIFYPRDKRMPIMRIPTLSWPNGFNNNPKQFVNILFAARLLEWPEPHRAFGILTETLGLAGDLRVETQSILKEFCLDTTPFSPDMVHYLPKSKEISAKELEGREDIRKDCVFTIDPLTARDLDDAVSVKELSNGHYEIGVHISDASYYLHEGTSLDKMVCSKATTIYLVDSVYHMLPVELCLHCSLLPGEDKLAFSVFWEINEQGEIFSTRFTRTVLNSCAQLAYEHAQQMIDDPNKEFKKEELPQVHNGFTAKDLSKTVNILQKIAVNLREARVRNGSLRIDQVKLLFSLNPRSGEPLDFIVYENKEAHRLIEEFMLLANISVARKISETFPDIAFLRCHEAPKYTMLAEARRCLETCGIHVDISSSGGIHSSLRKYITDDYQGFCRGIVLNHIFAKPMTRARYFCAGTMETDETYAHYALSVPIYTHFTSPIRRYADIMVHRLLAASLGYADRPNWELDQVISIAANCNKQKYNAKRAGEASSDLYLAHYIEKNQPYIQDCVVVDVKDRSFDAIVLKTGSMVRVYQKTCQDNPSWTVETIPSSIANPVNKLEHEKKVLRLIINFPKTKKTPESYKMTVEMFTVVKLQLKRVPNSYKLEPYLLRPVLSRTFERSSSVSA